MASIIPSGETSAIDCAKTAQKLKDVYDKLTRLPIKSILPQLYIHKVITTDQKKIIEAKHLESDGMQYFLDNVLIFSLELNVTEIYNKFIKVLEDSDDLMLRAMAQIIDTRTAIAPQRAITGTKTAMAHRRAIKGKHKANQFKIIMLGAEGAGKSCTVDSLLHKPFKHQPSTVGANIENTCTVGREFVTNWKPKKIHEQIEEISRHIMYEVKERLTEEMRDNETLLEQQEEQEKPSPEELTKAEEILQNKELPEGDIRVVIYDVGGQEIYYELQFLFLASLDVVFLAFDASKDLNDPVIRRYRYNRIQKVYKTRKAQTTLETIEFALQTIHSRCGVKSDSGALSYYTPTVVLVATHSKKCKNKNGVTKKLKDYLMEKNLSRHLIKNNFSTDGIIFIDNEERDDPEYKKAILRLQEIAVKASCSAIDENRYISYLNFEVAILEQSSCKFISWQDASIIAQNSGLEDDQDKLLQLLDFYTKRGILLYYPEVEALKNRVFISPQEVSDLVSTVIKIHEYTDDILLEGDLNNKCIRFDKFGLLEEDLLDDILEKSGRAKDKHIILGFLEKFDLVVEVDSDTKFENEQSSYTLPENGRVFFVPAMLIYNETETYRPNPESVDNVILYHFPDKYLPDIVFNHLLVSAIKWRKEYQYRIRRIFRGIGVFDFNNNKQSFTLQQCSETSCIKCYISVHQQEVNNMALWSQREKLLMCLEESILQIHDSCISKARKPIAYLDCPLRHNEQHEPHLVLKSITADAELFCSKSNTKIDATYYYLLVKLKNPPDPNTPTIQQLISQVRPEIAPKWHDLGVELLGKKYVKKLEVIGADNKGNTEGCCTEMFNFWLQTDTKASWTKLVEALRSKSVQHDVLADEIEKKFVAASDAANDEALDSGTKIASGGDKLASREDDTRVPEQTSNSVSVMPPSRDEAAQCNSNTTVCGEEDKLFGSSQPKLAELVEHVGTSVHEKWYDLGLQLGVNDDTLDEIEDSESKSNKACRKMFQAWLREKHGGTWNDVILALKSHSVGESNLAESLKELNNPLKHS